MDQVHLNISEGQYQENRSRTAIIICGVPGGVKGLQQATMVPWHARRM